MLSDDVALSHFIQNPLVADANSAAELKDARLPYVGLTKAERSVLRRVVMHLPSTAKSGFSARSMASYRRSLRLVQNVLHYSSTAVHANMSSAFSDVEAAVPLETTSQNGGTFYLYVYYPNGGSNDYTKATNADVKQNGGPYANYRYFQIVFGDGPTSVERLLLGASQAFPDDISYQTVDGESGAPYVSEITINGNAITANLDTYQITDDFVFWFYSVNGKPNKGGATGIEGGSFRDFPLNSGDTVFWQLIAPDADYGFHPCKLEIPITFIEAERVRGAVRVK